MKYDTLIPVTIVTTLVISVLNVFVHFMPYSAPPVLMMLTIAAAEVFDVVKNRR